MALTEQFNLTSLPEDIATAFAALQDNFFFLALCSARLTKIIPGWDTVVNSASSPQDFDYPDSITLTKTYTTESPQVTRTIQIEYTYTEYGSPIVKHPTTITFKFGDGTSSPSLETVTGGTITLVYDGEAGNLVSATSA